MFHHVRVSVSIFINRVSVADRGNFRLTDLGQNVVERWRANDRKAD